MMVTLGTPSETLTTGRNLKFAEAEVGAGIKTLFGVHAVMQALEQQIMLFAAFDAANKEMNDVNF